MKPQRRSFLTATAAGIAATSMTATSRARVNKANERINVGVIGCGGRGRQLARLFGQQKDAHVVYTCDPDSRRASQAKDHARADHAVADLRKVIEDKKVDAIVIAACDHWHAPAAIMGCKAGKHVYVEKPCSHSLVEGRKMVEAARKHKRVMQHGTQTRSRDDYRSIVEMLQDGVIGDVLMAKHINSQRRANIGHRKASTPPQHIDYDLWVGPAEFEPYQSNFVHYHWHWRYNFGTGDIGNDGVHGIDVARWGLGVDTHPSRVLGYGSKLYFDDDQQFPDTYTLSFEYPGNGKIGQARVLTYEQRIWSPYREDEHGVSVIYYGTKGQLRVDRSEFRIYGERHKLIKRIAKKDPAGDVHQRNFLDVIQGKAKSLNADIEVGFLSSALCHLGNIVSRTGRNVEFDPKSEKIAGDKGSSALLDRKYRSGHWAIPT